MRFIALLAVIFLSGCAMFSDPAEDLFCPEVGLIPYADTVSLASASAAINGFTGSCSFKKGSGVEIDLTLPFAARKKDNAGAGDIELPYFIAVLSPEEAILQRQAFSTTVSFDENGSGGSTEEQTVTIPMASPAAAYKYKVVMGLALTPEQLKYNKEKK
ncbi:MAG: hypothetical protein K8R48_03710 [Alphaproteobacteria bacterium]|nr:hypothetical protein [Alphaproteobacteria bacterium]